MSALLAFAVAVRVFSADFCADQLALALADKKDIAALSMDAARDFSFLRAQASGLPRARAEAEEVLSRDADLVLRYWGGDPHRLERLGVTTLTLSYAADFGAVKENIRIAAAALGQRPRGEALIDRMEARLAALASDAPPQALYVTPGGVTAGKGTMIDAIFSAAGVVNIAAAQGLEGWPPLPLESLVAATPPDLIVTGFFDGAAAKADHWSAARHPAFARVFAGALTIHLPADVLACPGFISVDAAEMIRRAADGDDGASPVSWQDDWQVK